MAQDDAAAPGDRLPEIDVHAVSVAAPPDAVWRALTAYLARINANTAAVAYGRLVRAGQRPGHGRFPERGATLPGFVVDESVPGRLLGLAGNHGFSRYTLTFELAEKGTGTLLRARSRAAFPGPHGAVYRALVIGTGGHRLLVRRMLRTIAHRAERLAAC